MSHLHVAFARRRASALLACVLGLVGAATGCSEGSGSDGGGGADAEALDAAPEDARALDAAPPFVRDAEIVVVHDAGAPLACNQSCDCPQGLGCFSGVCGSEGAPVYCCSSPGCPQGQVCLGENDRPSTCPAPDAGTAPPSCERPDAAIPAGRDGGVGSIGSACDVDSDCNLAANITCWDRSEPPFVWGYCTIDGCTGGCPQGSMCIQFNSTPAVTGCLQTCNADLECRTDAYCYFVPNGGFGICLPDCRDDVLDCAPRDGTTFCNPFSGRCDPNACHGPSAVGGACDDNRDCGEGLVCMTELGWGFTGGMCTRACQGLPESTPCGPGETCQDFAGVGLCFKDCVNDACPDRPTAQCLALDATWATPSCVSF